MKRFRLGLAAFATAAALAATATTAATIQPAGAIGDPDIGKQVLDAMCRDRGGDVYFTPSTITRCQEARTKGGFEIEALICEGLLGGRFAAVDNPIRPTRTNWACVSGPAGA